MWLNNGESCDRLPVPLCIAIISAHHFTISFQCCTVVELLKSNRTPEKNRQISLFPCFFLFDVFMLVSFCTFPYWVCQTSIWQWRETVYQSSQKDIRQASNQFSPQYSYINELTLKFSISKNTFLNLFLSRWLCTNNNRLYFSGHSWFIVILLNT